MRYILILIFVFFIFNLSSCVITGVEADSDELTIIATLFPQYDFARQIAGGRARVVLLLPPGSESHGFDPKPADMLAIRNADLFIYTGKDMEPWAQAIITGMNNITVVDCSENITLLSPRCDNLAHGADPHIWLNPDNAVQMIENIFAAISQKDPENHDFYRNNADEYIQKLRNLDENFRYAIENAERDTVVFGGRFAYIYFLAHYDLDYITAYDSCAAHAEPGAAQIARVKNFIRANNIPVIYHEELSNPRIARSIALETGIEYMQFSTAHNITKQEFDDGVTFLDIMRANLENLKKGLG